jgi:aspartate aminotransferase
MSRWSAERELIADEIHPVDQVSLGKIVQIRERLMTAARGGMKVYRFESGDPSFSIAPHVRKAAEEALAAGKTHYIPNAGIPELREALAAKVRLRNGIEADAEHVFVTNGAMHALYVLFAALVVPGASVIVPDPMWTEAVENIRLARGVPRPVSLTSANGFAYDTTAIERAITADTTAIFLNSPHNPTGAVLSGETLREIVRIARKHDLWIVADEAYEDVVYEPFEHVSIASVAGDYSDRVISIYSFSKSHAMSGLRVGYIVTRDALLGERIGKLLRCTINGVNSVAQWAALAAVTGPDDHLRAMQREYLVRRDIMIAALSGIPGITPFVPQGAFYVWAELDRSVYTRMGVRDADGLSALLASRGIGSTPGDAFGLSAPDALRFAFSCATEMVEEGSRELRRFLTERS